MSYKKSLKIPNAESKAVNRRRANNSMTIRNDTAVTLLDLNMFL